MHPRIFDLEIGELAMSGIIAAGDFAESCTERLPYGSSGKPNAALFIRVRASSLREVTQQRTKHQKAFYQTLHTAVPRYDDGPSRMSSALLTWCCASSA
jgi:hypothetical protein